MKPKKPLQVRADLDVIPFSGATEDPAWFDCAACGGPLDLHQPSIHSPDRLVGACDRCEALYMIFVGEKVLVVLLPDRESFESSLPAEESPGPNEAVE